MIGEVAAAVFLALLAAWVAEAFLSRRTRPQPIDGEYEQLIEAKESVYRAMLDLELDHKLGKVSEEDYLYLRKQHEAEAIDMIRKLDATDTVRTDIIEEEIAEVRRRLQSQ